MMGFLEIPFIIIGIVEFTIAFSTYPVNQDVNDPATQLFLRTMMFNYKSLPRGTLNEYTELIKINNSSAKIVNYVKTLYEFEAKGVKTHNPYKCHLAVLSRPGEGNTILSYNCQQESTSRRKRTVLGGETELDASNSHLLELKESIENELTLQLKTGYSIKIIKFIKASNQIVAGIITKAVVEVANSSCNSDIKNCSAPPKDHQFCNIEIWERPWLNSKEIKVKECNNIPYYCPGCPKELSLDDEQANQCLKRTLYNLNTKAHSQKQLKLLKITRVQSQVVAGLRYIMEFEAQDQSNSHYSCRSVIVSQPWISTEPLVDEFSCHLFKT